MASELINLMRYMSISSFVYATFIIELLNGKMANDSSRVSTTKHNLHRN